MIEINLAAVLSIITLVSWGLENSFYKSLAKILPPEKVIIFRNLFTVLMTGSAAVIFSKEVHFIPSAILLGVGLAFAGFVGYLYLLKAMAVGKLAVISPISSSRILIASTVGHFFLKDSLSRTQLIAIVLIFIGLCLVVLEKNSQREPKQVLVYAGLNALIWGVVFPLYSLPSAMLGGFLFAFILESVVLVSSLVKVVVERHPLALSKAELKQSASLLTAVGFFGGLGSICLNLGYATGHIGIVSAISASVPIVTVPFGLFVYKERLRPVQVAAVVLLLVGVLTLSYS